jgi:putative flippase GtrA
MRLLMSALRSLLARSRVRFGLVGVLNTITGLSIIYFLKWALSVPDVPANLVGYAVGLVLSYFLNARWTFSVRGPLGPALPRFALTILIAYIVNLAVVNAAIGHSINSYIAQAMGVLPYSLTTYLGSRFFVFNRTSATSEA